LQVDPAVEPLPLHFSHHNIELLKEKNSGVLLFFCAKNSLISLNTPVCVPTVDLGFAELPDLPR